MHHVRKWAGTQTYGTHIPEEHKNGIDMRRDMLRRSHVLVVCGGEVDEDVKNDIAVAKRLNITATTLDGIPVQLCAAHGKRTGAEGGRFG